MKIEHKNGWVKISYEITSDEMMIMQLRRWFPDMVVLSPNFSKILENYNKSLNEFD
ncbi:hypothetical protein [Campylobacter iguaniorum]|uniref:hypothetical protein n=1 Tax=Campylobacter iguaniorum TaxID=1244531 RepID=UPI000B1E8074|nr:hypothetical protein [Campylobacter iguaniorum]